MQNNMYWDVGNIKESLKKFRNNSPYDHCVVDDFFDPAIALKLEEEFLSYESSQWFCYKNPMEDKKALNDWNVFPSLTYQVFRELISPDFIEMLSRQIDIELFQDPGLHGGGWHIHGTGGSLNPHYDYSIHPKIGLQRKLNIIIYLSSDLQESHGGHLGLWSNDQANNQPKELMKIIQPKFNRAVIFDTTQNSWHGLCKPLTQPEGIFRKSMAVYYLTNPPEDSDRREKALFALRDDQRGNLEVEELIKVRADSKNFSKVYRTD